MNEQTETNIPKPKGEVILGLVDPRTLSPEAFKASGELLFHVTADRGFKYDWNHDYGVKLHPSAEYSSTIGNGFYTTDNREVADIILVSRGSGAKLIELLPFNAKMFDMRSKEDERINELVDEEMFENFRVFVNEKYKKDKDSGNPKSIYQELAGYLNRHKFVTSKEKYIPLGLRTMLGRGNKTMSETYANTFTEFIISQGYDGLIYIEGTDGDGTGKINCNSIVFFNPKVLGAYESWQQRKAEV